MVNKGEQNMKILILCSRNNCVVELGRLELGEWKKLEWVSGRIPQNATGDGAYSKPYV